MLTSNRPALFLRALTSVSKQNFEGRIRVLIVEDNCSYINPADLQAKFRKIRLQTIDTGNVDFNNASTLGRVAALRNLALNQVETELVAFLDDDNQWAENHLTSLYEKMIETGCPAVHSWRILVDENDREVIVNSFPWLKERARAVKRFELLVKLGLMSRESAIVYDKYKVFHNDRDYGMVDCGEWLFHSRTLQKIGFKTDFSETDEKDMIGEDDKLLSDLKRNRIPIACTRLPTLFYTLGGFSNRFDGENKNL